MVILEAKPVDSLSLSWGGGPCSDRAEEPLTPKDQEGGIQEVMEVDCCWSPPLWA